VLPPEARFATEALLFTVDRILAIDQHGHRPRQSAALRGVAAAPGTYTGPARVIQSEAQFARIERGDVLVCPVPSPAWSVLFSSIGALVTDTGGILSHAAIIAREYRVPAVVATGHGTRTLHDGQIVTVDGNTGDVWTASA
jgi:pyruvate,water dikinase